MKLLLNSDLVVMDIGIDFRYNSETGLAEKWNGDIREIIYGGTNAGNTSIVEVEDSLVPPNVVGKYKYVDGQFIRNPQWREPVEDSMFKVFQMTDVNIPKAESVDERINQFVDLLIELGDRPEKVVKPNQELVTALKEWKAGNTNSIANNFINKLRARFLIDEQIGDVYDLIADLSKQVYLLTGIVTSMYANQYLNYTISETNKTNYDTYCYTYRQLVDNGEYKDRADLENPEELVSKLLARNKQIASIVKSEYLDKKQ